MPYQWNLPGDGAATRRLTLWPHRSLPPAGFAAVMLGAFAMLMVPVLALLGKAELWVLLPFVLGVLALTWVLMRRNYRDGRLTETFDLGPDLAHLVRTEPDGRRRDWQANPYWVRVELHRQGRPVENYLVLKGGPRDVEIGAFLSPEERLAL
jgi:uncharacterized membrane protein